MPIQSVATSESDRPLRIAIVGAGKMAFNHARAVGRTEGRGTVVAVADPSETARDAFALEFPGVRTHPTLGDLLAAGQVDVVHVVTPPASHAALARQALEAGAHVYVEKPFVETASAAREVVDLAAALSLQLCAGHQLLFEPPTRVVEEVLPALGRIVHIESYFSFRPVRAAPGGRTPLRSDLQLLDILPHPVYLLLRALERAADGPVELLSLEVSQTGTVHALVQKGEVTATLVATLEGRPVESYLRIIGRNGSIFADYVRSTVQRSIGPGTSGIDKLLAPYRQARQLFFGTTVALGRRFLKRQRSYPGLAELFGAFYDAIRGIGPAPLTAESIVETVRICERVSEELQRAEAAARAVSAPRLMDGHGVLVTGGTGFLGKALVRELMARGRPVRVLARREPASWERVPGAEYVAADLAAGVPAERFAGIEAVIHCAAETAGGWEEHQRNSLDATERMVRGAAAAGVQRFIQVSSLAVLAKGGTKPIGDDHPLEPDSRGSGPYVWGKLESERLAVRLGQELGVDLKVVRPGALVDYADFDPPGRLGKRLGNLFVAMGAPGHRLGVVDVGFAAQALSWGVDHWAQLPTPLNLLDPVLPTKRELLQRFKVSNPDLTVLWLPTLLLVPMSWMAIVLQKVLRPGKPAIDVAKVFAVQDYDTAGVAALGRKIERSASGTPVNPARASLSASQRRS